MAIDGALLGLLMPALRQAIEGGYRTGDFQRGFSEDLPNYPIRPNYGSGPQRDEAERAFRDRQDAWDKLRVADQISRTKLPPDQRQAALDEALGAHVPIQEPRESMFAETQEERNEYWKDRYARERETTSPGMFELRENPPPTELAQPWRGYKEIHREMIPFSTEAAFQNTIYADEYKKAGGERVVRNLYDELREAGYEPPKDWIGQPPLPEQYEIAQAWGGNLSAAKADARRQWHNAERLRVLMSAAAMRQPYGPLREGLRGGDYDDPTMGMGPHFLGVPDPHKMQELMPLIMSRRF